MPEKSALPPKFRYCLYARKSSETDEKQKMSIEAQLKEMRKIAKDKNLKVVAEIIESHSAKVSNSRLEFNRLIYSIRQQKFDAILTWNVDRLSRNGGDLGTLIDLMDEDLLKKIYTKSQVFHNNPNEKFLLMILCSQAKLENDNRGNNVIRGQLNTCEKGGYPHKLPLGYKKVRNSIVIDPRHAPFIRKIFLFSNRGLSHRKIQAKVEKLGFRSRNGKILSNADMQRILANSFYTGSFERPRGSGKIYKGNYKAIISKKLFEKVRENNQKRRSSKTKWGSIKLDFCGILKCGKCGSGITGVVRKRQHNRTYYHCSRYGYTCKEKLISEVKLLELLQQVFSKIDIGQIGNRDEMEKKMETYKELQKVADFAGRINFTIRDYAQFILIKSSQKEKQSLFEKIKGQLTLKNQRVFIDGKDIDSIEDKKI